MVWETVTEEILLGSPAAPTMLFGNTGSKSSDLVHENDVTMPFIYFYVLLLCQVYALLIRRIYIFYVQECFFVGDTFDNL